MFGVYFINPGIRYSFDNFSPNKNFYCLGDGGKDMRDVDNNFILKFCR